MIDVMKLKGVIAENGLSQRDVGKKLGVTDKTFYTKMKKGIFDSDEMNIMIRELSIKDPAKIFFSNIGA